MRFLSLNEHQSPPSHATPYNFLRNKNQNIGNDFLENIKNIDAIPFNKSISLFHDLNTLTLIFYKKNINDSTKHNTKKIFIKYFSHKNTRRIK